MADDGRELLVILDAGRAGPALVDLRAVAAVTQLLPPRVALVAADPGSVPTIAAVPGVDGVYVDGVPPEVHAALTAGEQLFVDAWIARADPKQRPDDGKDWDDPDNDPPDVPSDPSWGA